MIAKRDLTGFTSKRGSLVLSSSQTYKDVDRDIILGLIRTARMSRERFFELLEVCK